MNLGALSQNDVSEVIYYQYELCNEVQDLLTSPLSHSVDEVFQFNSNLSLIVFHIPNKFMLKKNIVHEKKLVRGCCQKNSH